MGDLEKPNHLWSPLKCIDSATDERIALILLNQPLTNEVLPAFHTLWKKAVLRVAVDGGSNELYKVTSKSHPNYLPDIITGDFDSITPDIKQYYKDKGCEIIPTPDQDHTDFTKCLHLVVQTIKDRNLQVSSIWALCTSAGGRFDHVLSNVNTLFLASQITDIPAYIMDGDSIIFLMQKGRHKVAANKEMRGPWCGFIPMTGRCNSVTTTGFKWNLDGDAMEFGGVISTSNTWTDSDTVTIETDNNLVFTMGISLH